ncbi:MAG: signal protein [Ramlibacter sp.]|uniref:S1C family serine protease n=1 Tax=Ramlibacter sp. TaxID=1917967 RepID=UPI0026091048|nr:S1C family serine protease [Ramlibacter sp.]MDB5753506.1 signal protein [Ramlibacter sp.]
MALLRLARRPAALLLLWLGAVCGAPAATAQPGYQAMIDALTRANEAVVGIEVTAADGARSAETLGRQRSGSGVVIGPDGLILTIGYLVLEADAIQVVTHDHRRLPARAVAHDLATGFGLIRPLLPLRGISPVALGATAPLEPGEALLAAVGGEDGSIAMTQLVSRRPFSGYWEYHIESALFTSPPLRNHSGAPLFNQRGELLGIGSLFVGDALGGDGRLPGNMFVPVDLLKPILAELQQTGSTRSSHRPWLGLSSAEQSGRLHVVRVNREGPAHAAGLVPGDVVLAIDGAPVSTLEAFYKKLWSRANPDDEVQLTILKGSEIRQLTLKGVDRMTTLRRPAGI